MPAGLNLGGAFFTIYGDNEQILRSMAQARAATESATKAMTSAQKMYAEAAKSTNASIITMNVQAAEQQVRTAMVHANAVKSNVAVLQAYGVAIGGATKATQGATGATNAQSNATRNLGNSLKQTNGQLAIFNVSLAKIGATLATLTGFGAIASGALLVRESFLGVIDAAQKLNQETFRLNKQFGDLAPMYKGQAQALADLAGKPLSDAMAALNEFATVEKNYGLTTAQVIDLQQRSADAAALKGTSLEEAAKRVAPALRGEAEAIEYLGFSLQSDYLKALQDVNSETYKQWQQMGPRAKTQAILNEFQNQSNQYVGAAAERANSAAGAIDKMNKALEEMQAQLGTKLNPQLVAFAEFVSKALPLVTTFIEKLITWYTVGQQLAEQQGAPLWLRILMAPQLAAQVALFEQLSQTVKDIVAAQELASKPLLGPTLAEADANAAQQRAQQQKDIEEATKANLTRLDDLRKLAIQKEIEAEDSLYQSKKDALQADKDAQIEAANDRKDAALAAIRDQRQASEDAYEAELVRITKLKDAELAAADERHRNAQEALDQEKKAAAEASEAQQRRIKEQADLDIEASQQRLRDLKAALEQEDRARDAARLREDRALEDQTERTKRELADRHEAVLEGIAEEEEAARDAYEQEDRTLDARGKKIEDRHRLALRRIEQQQQAAEKAHDAAARQLEQQEDAAEKAHAAAVRRIEQEADAADLAHRDALRQIEDEATAADRTHDGVVEQLERELDAAKDRHEAVVGGLGDETDAAERAHRAIVDGLEDELALARELHDRVRDGLEAWSRAEDERHRGALAHLDAELAAQLRVVDAAIGALDAEKEARDRLDRLADLRVKVAQAEGTGNASKIADAQRALRDEELDQQADDAKATLRIRRDQLEASGRLAKDQAEAQHRLIEAAIKDEQDLADATLAQVQRSVDARRDAADAALDGVKDGVEARRRAADAELALVERSVRSRRDAADAELATIEQLLDARKVQADDEYARIAETLDARKVAAADELQLVKDGLAARKDALDQEKAKRQEVADDAKDKADEQARRDKDALERRKIEIGDERDAHLKALEQKKQQEDDDNQEAGRRNEDFLTAEKRRIADQRTAEDLAAQDRRTAAEETARVEQEQISDTSQAQIQASKDALEQYNAEWGLRKSTADTLAREEIAHIHAVYDDPATGLLPRLKQAFEDTKEWYDKRTIEVNAQYDNERKQIADTFDHPEHGLFKKLADIHNATIDGLKDTKKDWEDNFQKPIEAVTAATMTNVQNAIKAALDKIDGAINSGGRGRGDDPNQEEDPDRRRGGGGMGQRLSGGGQYRPIVAGGHGQWTSAGTHGGHPAVDIFAPTGTAIRAPVSGTSDPAYYPLGGNATTLDGDDGRSYYLAHGNVPFVGGRVEAGQQIGEVGKTGNAQGTSPHLHFAIARNGGTFGALNGSGDIEGDDSYWTGRSGEIPNENAPPDGAGAGAVRVEDGYLVFTLFGRRYRIKLPGGRGAAGSPSASEREIERYIAEAAERRGIDGDVAVAVAKTEGVEGGRLVPMAVGKSDSGWSFWPFQAHYGGKGYEQYGYQAGQGTRFTKDTGWQPEDARAWKASVDWQLAYAKKHGWGEWYGAARHGIGDWDGIKQYARGGYIPEPTLLVGQTLGPYAMAGEVAPEWVTPQAPGTGAGTGAPIEHLPVNLVLGNQVVEKVWITGYKLHARRGSLPSRFGEVP